jgi:hypothetical protein
MWLGPSSRERRGELHHENLVNGEVGSLALSLSVARRTSVIPNTAICGKPEEAPRRGSGRVESSLDPLSGGRG